MNAFLIVSNNALALSEPGNIQKLGFLYFDWTKKVTKNTFEITGNIIKYDWISAGNNKTR